MLIERGQSLCFESLGWRLLQHGHFANDRFAHDAMQGRHSSQLDKEGDLQGLSAPCRWQDLVIPPGACRPLPHDRRPGGRG